MDEKVIAKAENEEPWGHFQFPTLSISDDEFYVSWSMNEDNISNLGKGKTVRMMSSNEGKSWKPITWDKSKEGVLLPNGCRIKLYTKPSVKLLDSIKEKSIGELKNSYSRRKVRFYYDKDLPPKYQGAYLARNCNGKFQPYKVNIKDPDFIRYEQDGILPFVWWGNIIYDENSQILYAAMSPSYYIEDGTVKPSGVIIYESSDFGISWSKKGVIKYFVDPKKDKVKQAYSISDGFMEPSFLILKDGTFVCVVRSTNGFGNRPLYFTKSIDKGATWSKPKVIAKSGVMPKLVQLENGVIVLSTGRPGIQLYYSSDGGDSWSDKYIVLDDDKGTCGYTGLKSVSNNRFMLVYSDFTRKNSNNLDRKAIVSKTFSLIKEY
ncbi:sialidase family protein [Echinicola strongylocentroti]|nr:sialidase family protein [Echinicola strongylocentroti]